MLVPEFAHLDLVVIEAVNRIAMLSYGDGLAMGVASSNKQTVFLNKKSYWQMESSTSDKYIQQGIGIIAEGDMYQPVLKSLGNSPLGSTGQI